MARFSSVDARAVAMPAACVRTVRTVRTVCTVCNVCDGGNVRNVCNGCSSVDGRVAATPIAACTGLQRVGHVERCTMGMEHVERVQRIPRRHVCHGGS